jgi:membrane-associated PAP2 superfamily phosphatase
MQDFLGGTVAMGFAVSALFFLRFWRQSREGLFLAFACSFLLMAVAQTLLTVLTVPLEDRTWIYLVRLIAFLIIIAAIWRHNRPAA